jgi:hypothetical protein
MMRCSGLGSLSRPRNPHQHWPTIFETRALAGRWIRDESGTEITLAFRLSQSNNINFEKGE